MAANFKVQGELALNASGFVGEARQAKAALEGVDQAARKVGQGSAVATTASTELAQRTQRTTQATVQQAQAQTAAGTAARAMGAEIDKAAGSLRVLETVQARAKTANDNFANSFRRTGAQLDIYQKTQLSFQLNDVFTQLASGQGAVRTLVQQGPQITQIFGGVGNTLRAIPLVAAGYVAAIGAVVGITIAAISHLNDYNARQRQSENLLQATGRAAQVSASQVEALVSAESRRPGAGRADTQQAAQTLLTNSALSGEAVGRTLALARDLARVTGSELTDAASLLSSGLDGTVAGARKLDAIFNALTPAELAQVRRFEELGQKGQAVAVVLTALERNLAGANEKGVGPLERSTANLRSAWNTLLDSLAKTGVIDVAAGAIRQLALPLIATAQAIEIINKYGASGGGGAANAPDPGDIDKARKSLEFARQRLAEAEAAQKQNPGDYQFENAVNVARRNVNDLAANVAQLEARAGAAAAKTVQDEAKGQATAAELLVKNQLALLDRTKTVAGTRSELEGELAQHRRALASGLLAPADVARTQETIENIKGQIAGLRTPAQELQRTLDLQSRLAALPPKDAAPLQAYLEAKRQMLEATGDIETAERAGEQARRNVLQQQATATGQQIQLLSAEAQAALKVADAYGQGRAGALRLSALLKAQAAEQQGQIAGGTAGAFAQQTLEEAAASAIATAAEKNEAHAREVAALDRLVEAEGRSSAAAREAERANKVAAYAEDLRAQAAATNSAAIIAAAEKQIAKYDELTRKAMQAEIRRDANQLNRQYDPQVAYDQDAARLRELQASGVLTARTVAEATKQYEQQRLDASRDPTDGMIAGVRRYADEAMNAGKAAADGVISGLRTIEDTIVQVAMTGQISWSNMVNSMIADLIRLAARKAITGPIADALGGINWGSIFGGSGGTPAATSGTGAGVTAPTVSTGYFHGGGMAGSPMLSRQMPAWLFASAPRLHGGGMLGARERPAVLLDDEEVLTSRNPRHRWNFGRAFGDGGGERRTEVHIHPPAGHQTRQQETDLGGGNNRIEIFIEKLKDSFGDDILGQRGPVFGAMTTTFGLQPRGRS